ncbi:hypothetical protein H17ap60334_01966 [Thermosipho africanus H17ap60334]|jgi:CRISPR-associated protein Csh1|uniref:Uncharacterized protein n=1 Tax=Thermosipho africanus (strain TCF52B) TaxID=484019 RepID=B7IHB7_THEAB|nr:MULTISPECIES: hypothetical protein [Thermosipho]ACJ75481.1 hypothetical protein THA_1023 [Thermosipho africanus TCF52B]EKF49972.1 hypothetical protein H17ap60334_01966 [Thermosipho africanus H17ap60334]MBZ4650635.1 hypothetical protein [Thermosipho sp. (in: thermotogales)]MDK2840106.1 hypothetical protein [Thermosipho sp. (in: thermotogales)]
MLKQMIDFSKKLKRENFYFQDEELGEDIVYVIISLEDKKSFYYV